MTKEELLEEAKRRYPIGTKIKLPNGNITEIKENIYFDTTDLNIIWNNGYGRIYDNGKWAEIISKLEEKVEEIPQLEVGKWYKHQGNHYLKVLKINKDSVEGNAIGSLRNYFNNHKWNNPNNNCKLLTDLSEIQQYLPDGHPDKIKSMEINEFKKGDYIVTLDIKDICTYCAKKNYCFKQRNNNIYVEPERDLSGNEYNNNTFLTFDKKSSLINWRYATPEEIAEYDRLGKPFNVTTLHKKEEPKSLIGRYLKALVDKPECVECANKNEYFLIQSENNIDAVDIKRIVDNSSWWLANISEIGRIWELMPEGFNPDEVKEEIPEYVECTDGNMGSHYTGKIYKVENGKISCEKTGTPTRWSGFNSGGFNFKPSTKEAYDRQQKDLETWKDEVEQKYIPKVGDWIIYIKNEGIQLDNNQIKLNNVYKIHNIDNDKLWLSTTDWISILWMKLFRKAEPHEIPKENPMPAYMIDDTCTISPPEKQIEFETKPQWLEDLNDIWPETVKKQSNKIEVKLIPVKKLIKN